MMMKNLILITLTSVLLVACSQKSVVPLDSLVARQGIWYELNYKSLSRVLEQAIMRMVNYKKNQTS
ncbi:hypothetical protein N9390_05260 [Gammaproteobacteria bacterium]|nr:hypothetical protein [Gammaproteobacteria bacterium]